MSEENLNQEKKCYKKLLIAGVIVSLVLSILSFTISIVAILGASGHLPSISANSNLPISKKYDRGRSLKKALKKNKPVVIWFYVDWCGYCQRFAPTFDEITKDKFIKKNYAVAFVNCEDPKNQELLKEYGIQGFPTVYLLNPKTQEKLYVDNFKLFMPNAKDVFVSDSKKFIETKK